ncbi:pyridoxal phosphate-dependent aminotransferase [bacterium]|nr:pyridoxal phosphate-dependent aminotransferase [bacterium]
MQQPTGSLISYMSNLVKQHGGINCAQGVPGFAPPEALLDALQYKIKTVNHQYSPSFGIARLRAQIAKRYGVAHDSVFVTNGATEAISTLYMMVRKRKGAPLSVGAFNPVYESYRNLPNIFDDSFVPFELPSSGIVDIELFEQQIVQHKTDLFFIASPGNPWGVVFSKERVSAMIAVCEKHRCTLIVDAVYSDIWQKEETYIPWKAVSEYLFVVSSFSKMFSVTGWRVGWAVIPLQLKELFQTVHDYTGLSGVTPFQEVLADFLEQRSDNDEYLKLLRKNTKLSYDVMEKTLVELAFKPLPVDGGYFVWAKLPETLSDDVHFALDLFEKERVATVPGRHFNPESTDFIRLNIARPVDEIREATERIKHYFL